eukprot:CAMPEP_0204271124 /NCGR_PEP_ID=MMETSP0468-20130131/19280_1 /ASSEMBLY_ACC=CAM_ASM_000383 /TAXON_ID=2969 /ORGANISM="Oxyrrhis marina" /LENGTH=335 /DNA_ID=CAMNT_0051246741 /DNA_START=36 /DNA_END=1043 /DNA_ORIENTATION=+
MAGMRVGIVGMGRLGSAVAGNLLRGGARVTVYDLAGPSVCTGIRDAGATWARSAREVAEQSPDAVITALPRPEHVTAAMEADNGILEGLQAGSTWIEHSTTDFENTLRIKEKVEGRGAHAMEAPLTGGMTVLKQGKMVTLVGADAEVLERNRPLLAMSCQRIVPCGPFGHATIVKLLSNMLCAVNDVAMGEAMVLAKKSGVDMKLMFDAIRVSSGNSFCWETEVPLVLRGSYEPDFAAELMVKDMDLGIALGKKHGAPMAFMGHAMQVYEQAMAKYGKEQGSTIPVRLIADNARVELADEKSKEQFAKWYYSSVVDKGSFQILHHDMENPFGEAQ